MRYEAMDLLKSEHSVAKMARVLRVNASAYYQWKSRQKRQVLKHKEEEILAQKVRAVFEDSRCTYGYRKMTHALADAGITLSEYRVRHIMRSHAMYPVSATKYRSPRADKATGRYLDNLFKQDFKATKLNEKWAGDITCIMTSVGWVYMAAVIDLCNKEVVGYEISKKADTELVCRALSYALARRNITKNDKLTFHCDRGVQYASKRFQTMLETNHVQGSMSRAGCPYDNAPAEGFFSTAKRECIYRKNYSDLSEVKRDLFDYIEIFYNRKRIQAGLGYVSPATRRSRIQSRKAA